MNAQTEAPTRAACYVTALHLAGASASVTEVMRAHCAALDTLAADSALLASGHGRMRLVALAETLRAAAERFAAPPAATPPEPTAPPHARRIDFRWVLDQPAAFRPLLRQYGIEADYIRTALLACCRGEEWRALTPAEVALAATNCGYDDRHLRALAESLRHGPLANRIRTDAVLRLLDGAVECFA